MPVGIRLINNLPISVFNHKSLLQNEVSLSFEETDDQKDSCLFHFVNSKY